MPEFVALPLTIETSGKASTTQHYIYFKQHNTKKPQPELPPKKTLFVLNPPLDALTALAAVFGEAGGVSSVQMTKVGGGVGQSQVQAAYVVFKKAASLQRALAMDTSTTRLLPTPDAELLGLKRWEADYAARRPDAVTLQKQIDADMESFDDVKAKEKAIRLAMDGKQDEEGWTVVAKGGKLMAEDVEQRPVKKAKKDKELQNFYRFQQVEARKEQIAVMRKKFDLDKLRVAQMRTERKFRPY